MAYIPYAALTRISTSATKEVTSFYVSAGENSTVDAARERLTEILKERFDQDEDAFSVSSQNALESAMSSVTSILAVLLGGIAAISLIVGGIGIMNIMLVTVTERTREIGIRKAIGASRGMILTQFLVEMRKCDMELYDRVSQVSWSDEDNCMKVYFRDVGFTALFKDRDSNKDQFTLYKSLENGFAKDLLCAGEVDMRYSGFAYVRNYDKRCVNG